jgi:uncharacterized membrane protein YeiH
MKFFSALGKPGLLFLTLGEGLTRSVAITGWAVDGIRASNLKDTFVACVVCGTLSGSGGGLIANVFGITRSSWSLAAPIASYDMKLSCTVVFLYLACLRLNIDPEVGKGVCAAFNISMLCMRIITAPNTSQKRPIALKSTSPVKAIADQRQQKKSKKSNQ